MGKIERFLKSNNKCQIAENVFTQLYGRVIWRKRFGAFGGALFKPDRLIGVKNVFVGKRVSILHHARIETISTFGKTGFSPKLTIGDDTSIGQNLHLIAAGDLRIGNNVTISGNVFISDTMHDYKQIDVNSIAQSLIWERTEIGDYSFIGYGAVIQAGAVLGKQCIVGSNAVVRKGIYPDYSVLAGVPAKVIRKYDKKSGTWERKRTEK